MQDSFFLLNREIGANYFATVNSKNAAGYNGKYSTLEFNAGLQPTHLRAKLFLSAKHNIRAQPENSNKDDATIVHKHDEVIFSGDTVRLKS